MKPSSSHNLGTKQPLQTLAVCFCKNNLKPGKFLKSTFHVAVGHCTPQKNLSFLTFQGEFWVVRRRLHCIGDVHLEHLQHLPLLSNRRLCHANAGCISIQSLIFFNAYAAYTTCHIWPYLAYPCLSITSLTTATPIPTPRHYNYRNNSCSWLQLQLLQQQHRRRRQQQLQLQLQLPTLQLHTTTMSTTLQLHLKLPKTALHCTTLH